MKGIVFDIKHFAIHDGPGIRTSIFFKGCPLRCWWCHNPESQKCGIEKLDFKFNGADSIGWETSANQLLNEVEKDRPFYEQSGGGITFSGGEPLLQADFLLDAAKLFKQNNLHLTLDTTGYASSAVFEKVSQYIDLVLYDLKLINPEKHKKFTGAENQQILKNLEYLIHANKEVQIRFPLIPGINDNLEDLEDMSDYLNQFKAVKDISVLPYHRIARGKYDKLHIENRMIGIEEPNQLQINSIKLFFENNGFKLSIGG